MNQGANQLVFDRSFINNYSSWEKNIGPKSVYLVV